MAKSSIVTTESRNETYSLKIRYSRTDCFQLSSKRIIDKHIAITKQNTIRQTISKLEWTKACPEKELFTPRMAGFHLLTY